MREKVRESHGADTEVREGVEEVLQRPEQRSPLPPTVKPVACLQIMKTTPMHMSTLQPIEDPRLEQLDIPRRLCNLWRAQIGEFLLKEAAGHGGSTLEEDKKV